MYFFGVSIRIEMFNYANCLRKSKFHFAGKERSVNTRTEKTIIRRLAVDLAKSNFTLSFANKNIQRPTHSRFHSHEAPFTTLEDVSFLSTHNFRRWQLCSGCVYAWAEVLFPFSWRIFILRRRIAYSQNEYLAREAKIIRSQPIRLCHGNLNISHWLRSYAGIVIAFDSFSVREAHLF